jgi:hypothetical protein
MLPFVDFILHRYIDAVADTRIALFFLASAIAAASPPQSFDLTEPENKKNTMFLGV